MMKFFRKHNKKLLAIFMTLLMIVFIGGTALDSLLQPQINRLVADTRLGRITSSDQNAADSTTRILEALNLNWQVPFGGMKSPLDVTDWILLTREAEQLDTTPDLDAIRSNLSFPVENIARQMKRRPEHIIQALAEFAAVRETALSIGGATAPGEAQLLAAAKQAFEKVRVSAVVLPASLFVDEDAPISDAEAQAHFEKYREREPGEGLEFGYHVAPAVNVQFIKIDRSAIQQKIGTTRAAHLAKKAEQFYGEQRETNPLFRRAPREDLQTYAASTTEAHGQLAGPPEPPFMGWSEARPIALDAVTRKDADTAIGRLADWLVQRLSEEWLDSQRDENGYKIVPESVGSLDHYGKVLEGVPGTIAFANAVSTATTGFFTAAEANDVAGLGQAVFADDRGLAPERLGTIAFRTQATFSEIPSDRNINRSDYLSMYETSRYPLKDGDGNLYIIRVVDVREGHTPESLDEVRERVVSDLRTLRGFEEALARAESIRSCDTASSLLEAFEEDSELVELRDTPGGIGSGFYEPPPFSRAAQYQVTSGQRDGLTDTPMFIAGGLGLVPRSVVERCFELEYEGDRRAILEIPERGTVLVVEWSETLLPDGADFQQTRESFLTQMTQSRYQNAIAEWLDPENIRARNGFEMATN